ASTGESSKRETTAGFGSGCSPMGPINPVSRERKAVSRRPRFQILSAHGSRFDGPRLEMPESPLPADLAPATRPLLLEVLLAGVSGALFFAAFLLLPVAGALALPLAAVPIVRVAHRRGAAPAFGASLVAAVLVFLIAAGLGAGSGVTGALFALAITGLPAFFASSVRRGVNPSLGYLGLCAAGLVLACG